MPLVNTSRINPPKYYCTRTDFDHKKRKRISKEQWDQDGMCDDCACSLWDELTSFMNENKDYD